VRADDHYNTSAGDSLLESIDLAAESPDYVRAKLPAVE
jgi:hypothetical protein